MIDDTHIRGLLASFTGGEVRTMIVNQIGIAQRRIADKEAELGRLSDLTLKEITEDRPRRIRVRNRDDDPVEQAADLKHAIENYRKVTQTLEVFKDHIDQSKIYLLTESEVRELNELYED